MNPSAPDAPGRGATSPDPSGPDAPPLLPSPAAPVRPWASGLRAARANLVPGLVLSAFAAGVVLAYATLPPVRAGFDRVGTWKVAGGFLFSIVSTGIFGGVLPWLINRLRPVRPGLGITRPPVSHLLFLAAFWGYKGVEVDAFYRFQTWLWGDAAGPAVVAGKVLLDLGVWCAVWAVPSTALGYAFMEGGFTRDGLRRWLIPGWFRKRVVPIIVSNFLVWAPACAAIYCLPPALQLPVQNLVLCFWALLLVLQIKAPDPAARAEG